MQGDRQDKQDTSMQARFHPLGSVFGIPDVQVWKYRIGQSQQYHTSEEPRRRDEPGDLSLLRQVIRYHNPG